MQQNFRLLGQDLSAVGNGELRIGQQFLAFRQGLVEFRRSDSRAGLDQQQADLGCPFGIFRQRLFEHGQGVFQTAASAKALAQQVQAGRLAMLEKTAFPRSRKKERGQPKRLDPLFAAGFLRGPGGKGSQNEVGAPQSLVLRSLLAARRSAICWASAVLPRSNAPRAMARVTGFGVGL